MKKRIFIIDDDPDVVCIATDLLTGEGYIVSSSGHPAIALKKMRENPPDLILLDVRLPDTDGYEVCREIKADPGMKNIPVLMVSAKTQETDAVAGLQMGADDYIRKPLLQGELLARVKAALRRTAKPDPSPLLEAGPLRISPETYSVIVDGKSKQLRPKEFKLLSFFLARQGQVLTRGAISENVWGIEHVPTSRTIDFHVDQLRKKLGPHGGWIKSLRGVGYKFEIED